MPELRRDPVTRRWVIIATDRARRPLDLAPETPEPTGSFCPFCEGNEEKTPPEILAYRANGSAPNGPGWTARVVPNKFPALQVEGDLDKRPEGLYDSMNGIGAHEVIIETPQHHRSLTDLTVEQIRDVLWVYRERMVDLKRDGRLVYGTVFKNVGTAAGATLEHTYSQLIATPVVPETVRHEMAVAAEYHEYRGRCIFCDILVQERDAGERIVSDDGDFVAFAPYASRFPFETWILPAAHHSHFETLDRAAAGKLAATLKTALTKIEGALDRPPYNYVIHTGPFNADPLRDYHWHMEIIPRVTKIAGFEWGTGFYMNPVPPEDAAAFLRKVDVDSKKADHRGHREGTEDTEKAGR